ncbi:hypothetical protein LUZ60_013196 [Juncus effusus]|nr:hypothetical protein LUZ60_013196 [Juncus effusus]
MHEWLGKIASLASLSSIPGKAVETVVEKVVGGTYSLVESEVTRFKNVEEEMERLKRTCERINSLLTDAEERRYIEDDNVKLWLCELRSISFDSDDLLGEYQTALSIYKHNSSQAGSSRKRKYLDALPSLSWSPEWGPLQRRKFSTAIDKINKKLDDINNARKNLRLRGADGTMRQRPGAFQPTCHIDPAKIVGRGTETKIIIDLLKSDGADPHRKIHVVVIHGTAAIGKTTLAKKVFDEIDGDFQKIWVCLSGPCDSVNTTKEILKEMTNRSCDLGTMNMILDSIRDHLKQSTAMEILLAIDNLWTEGFHFWDPLQAALLSSKKKIKVLITTRNERIGSVMLASCYNLMGLNEDECFELLGSQAGIDKQNEILVSIGKNIATRCGGSPMAAKILGAHLHGKGEEEWTEVLSEMRSLKDDRNEVMPSLKISYHHLPYHIKLCYSYCSIFPNGYKFEKDQVIRYWLAEGLIQPEGRRRLELVGSKYFDDLVWRSFFEKVPSCNQSHVEYYRIPSLMYDLARHVSQYEFVELESSTSHRGTSHPSTSLPELKHVQARRYCSLLHRAYQGTNPGVVKIENVYPYLNLRTLKLCGEYINIIVPLNLLSLDLFRNLKCLRVLDLSNSGLKNLPDSVSELIHLRYLGLSNTKIEKIPEKLSELFNLQTLELKGCLELKELPQGMSKLVNLRHLELRIEWEEITDSTKLVIPQGIKELELLQTCSRFNVPSDNSKGQSTINELKDLNLRGDLCILNLENVQTPEDARDANLRGKQFIENLMLRWSESPPSNPKQWSHSKDVLTSLQPNNRIKRLWIMNYPGTNFPRWVGDSSFSSLEAIRISNHNNFTFLSLLGGLPRLKNLHIENIAARTIRPFEGFQSLENLTLLNLLCLERLTLENEMPKIRKVYISECPNLKDLVIHREVYNKFERGNCAKLTNIVYVD